MLLKFSLHVKYLSESHIRHIINKKNHYLTHANES